MAVLAELKCTVCQVGDIPLDADEIAEKLKQVPGWAALEEDGVSKLRRVYRFQTYPHTLAFTQAVGTLAEAEGHHPRIITEWGKVTVLWWTHKIGGLHENDFIMAAKTDRLLPLP